MLSFPLELFPKAQEHFIPFHTPGELSITMKEILKMTGNARSANSQGRQQGKEETLDFKGKLFEDTLQVMLITQGDCGFISVPGSHLGFMCTLLRELGKAIVTLSRSVAELLVHWSKPSCCMQLAQTSTKSSELVGYFILFCFVAFFLPHANLLSVYIFYFHRKSLLLPFSIAVPGSRWLLPPSPLLCSPDHFFTDTLDGKRGLFWCPLF